MNILRSLTLLLLAAAMPALALDLTAANFSSGSGAVIVSINDQDVTGPLAPGQFADLQSTATTLRVRFLRASDRTPLAAETLQVAGRGWYHPMLALVGNGTSQPYAAAWIAENDNGEVADGGVFRGNWLFSMGDGPQHGRVRRSCQAGTSSSETEGSIHYGRPGIGWSTNPQPATCTTLFAGQAFGVIEVSAPEVAGGTHVRHVLIGDGGQLPFQLLLFINGEHVASAFASPAVGAPTLIGKDFWYDVNRPAQAVSLYEMPAAGVVIGTWNTFAEDGRHLWYILDGNRTQLPGQRDIAIHEASRPEGEPARLQQVGTARLMYLDCNQAELRLLIPPGDLRTLRLARSETVLSCGALSH